MVEFTFVFSCFADGWKNDHGSFATPTPVQYDYYDPDVMPHTMVTTTPLPFKHDDL